MMAELTRTQKNRMHALGYKAIDYADLSVEEVDTILASKTRRPGSKAKAAAVAASIGMPGLPSAATDEGIAARQADKPLASAYVIRSDHESDLLARAALRKMGSGVAIPTDEIAQPYVDANPDRDFRWMTATHCKQRGTRGWAPVYDAAGKKVTHLNEGRWLAHKPKDVREAQLKEYRDAANRASKEAHEAMDSTVERLANANKGTGTITTIGGNHPLFKR